MKWWKLFVVGVFFLSSKLYALTLTEEANLRVKNANVFKVGDIIELKKGRYFLGCNTIENLNKTLAYAAKKQLDSVLAILSSNQCSVGDSLNGKYKVVGKGNGQENWDVIKIVSVSA